MALLHTLRWVQYFIAHICHCKYSQYTLRGAYRDYNSRKLDQLSEQIVTLTSSFAEFSKSVSSALEDIKSHGSDTNSIFTYSKLLPCLDRTGFESIPYWNRGPWSEVRNRKTTVDTEDPVLVLFCEDENGHVVSKDELKALHNTVRVYFEFLWTKKVAPPCWGDAPLDLRIDFVRKMEEEYKWLRYCDRHWKSEQLFMNYYPQWYKSKTNPRKTSKRKGRPDGDENPSVSKHPRVEGPEATPPPAQPPSTNVTEMRRRVRLPRRTVFIFANDL